MPPTALFTVITPSPSVQVAGDLSFISTHSSRLVPSNSTTASDGGDPFVPGLTIAGTGGRGRGRGACRRRRRALRCGLLSGAGGQTERAEHGEREQRQSGVHRV